MKSSASLLYSTTRPKVNDVLRSAENQTSRQATNKNAAKIAQATSPAVFNTVQELTRRLTKNVLGYSRGRFVVLEKPYGVSCVGTADENGGVFKNTVWDKQKTERRASNVKETNSKKTEAVTISDCLPELRKALREPNLSFCTGVKRYLSGAIVLPCNERDANSLKSSIREMSANAEPPFMSRALAITLNRPEKEKGLKSGFATFRNVGSHKEYIFEERKATNRAKSGKFAVEGKMSYQVLGTKNGCSLVEFSVDKFARHLPRLMLSQMNSPILGDAIYWRRLGDIDGRPEFVQPGEKEHKIWVPPRLGEILNVEFPRSLVTRLPIYCHVYSTVFEGVNENEESQLVASSPPPAHFMAMLDLLQLAPAFQKFKLNLEKVADSGDVDDTTVPSRITGETKF